TYVIFDAEKDMQSYRFNRGWKPLEHLDFDFDDGHVLGSELTDRASEETVNRRLRERFSSTDQVVVLIGPNTRNLYRFVRWEIQVALDLKLPIIAVNLNGKCDYGADLCPPMLRDEYVVH